MRRVTSIILMIAFISLSISGLHMALVPRSQNIQQQMLGNHNGDKLTARGERPFYPKKAHEWSGYIFIATGLVHIGLNRRPILSYFKPKKTKPVG